MDVQHVFIVGSKGIPGAYGGYETFVDKLTEYYQSDARFKSFVSCQVSDDDEKFVNRLVIEKGLGPHEYARV